MIKKYETIYLSIKEMINKKVDFEYLVDYIEKCYDEPIEYNQELIYISVARNNLEDHNEYLHYYWYLRMIIDIFRHQKCKDCLLMSLFILKQYYVENKDDFKHLPIQKTTDIPIIKIKEVKCKYCNLPSKEFKINKYITLKLEDGITNIYVNGMKFNQCKYLVFNINLNDVEKYDKIDSIDDIEKKDRYYKFKECKIDPETEFWGHCSNLQSWFENDYDTRLLHSNLSFPLLKKLMKLGDPVAKKVYKDEIVFRFKNGNKKIKTMLVDEDYISIDLFTLEELQVIFENDGYCSKIIRDFKFVCSELINLKEKPLSIKSIEYVVEKNLDFNILNDIMYVCVHTVKLILKTECIGCRKIRLKKFRMEYEKLTVIYRHSNTSSSLKEKRENNKTLFDLKEYVCRSHILFSKYLNEKI